jgi:hypothetical protein
MQCFLTPFPIDQNAIGTINIAIIVLKTVGAMYAAGIKSTSK